jgi:hypothetical protein
MQEKGCGIRLTWKCAPVYQSCEQIDFDLRCKPDPDAVDALYLGDLDRLYESITNNPAFEQYGSKVLSRPLYAPGDTAETSDYQLGPWIVVFENAVSDEEADRFIKLGSKVGCTRSVTNTADAKEKDGKFSMVADTRPTSTTLVPARLCRRPYCPKSHESNCNHYIDCRNAADT